MEVAVAQRCRQRLQRAEIAVVALTFTGDRGVDRVVDVVVPLCGHAEAAPVPRSDQPGVVEVALGDQGQRPADFCCQGIGFGGEFLENVIGGGVDQRVNGVQSQAVGVEVTHPAQCAVQDVAAHLVGIGVGDIDRLAPRVAPGRQVRAELGQVVARRAEVVEHRVDQHAEAAGVAGVDEADQCVGSAVGFVHRVPEHAVVAPAVGSAERVDRHQLDEVDTEVDQVVELLDRRVEGSCGGEGSGVQFVDHAALDGAAGPAGVGPCLGRRPPQLRAFVDAVGLSRRARVGQHLGIVVEDESVAGVRSGVDDGTPPCVLAAGHRV